MRQNMKNDQAKANFELNLCRHYANFMLGLGIILILFYIGIVQEYHTPGVKTGLWLGYITSCLIPIVMNIVAIVILIKNWGKGISRVAKSKMIIGILISLFYFVAPWLGWY